MVQVDDKPYKYEMPEKSPLDIHMKQPSKQPECFGYYDDGNEKCEECEWSDMCFEKGCI